MKHQHSGTMPEVGGLLAETIDGGRSLDHVRQIGHFDRSLGSGGYHSAAEYVQGAFERMQLESRLVTWPMDDAPDPWNWSVPRAWEPEAGVFRIVSPEQRTLVNFVDTPTCIHPWSASTPEEGVTAEIVYVGEGLSDDDYAGKDVSGKIVFADRGANWLLYVQAIQKRGALGYISDDILEIPGVKTRDQFPDMVLWYTFYERELNTGEPLKGWGISISPRMGDYLRGLLEQGPVTGYCRVAARTFDGVMENVLGSIEGEDAAGEEFLCMAHLDHYRPGAMDNASGCSVLLEAADTLRYLIDQGKLPRPRRSIRFLFGQEGHMSNVYPHEMGSRIGNIIGSWTVDTVGATPHEVGGPLLFLRGSASNPSFLNDLGVGSLKESSRWYPGMGQQPWVGDTSDSPVRMDQGISTFKFDTLPYGIHSDNACIAGWGVPAVGIVQWPSTIWHTQYDTVDRLDATELARCAWTTAYVSYRVASAGPSEAIAWMYDVAESSRRRLADLARRARHELLSTGQAHLEDSLEAYRDHLLYLADRDSRAIASCSSLVDHGEPGVPDEIDDHQRKLGERLVGQAHDYFSEVRESLLHSAQATSASSHGENRPAMQGLTSVPKRVRPGLINMKYQAIAFGPQYADRDPLYMDRFAELMNLSDGTRTISEIARIVGYELGDIDPLLVVEMFETLRESEYVTLLDEATALTP